MNEYEDLKPTVKKLSLEEVKKDENKEILDTVMKIIKSK